MYQVIFYTTRRGESPVENFINSLDNHSQGKTCQFIAQLGQLGPTLKRPFADKLEGKLYELRPRQARMRYFFFFGHKIVMAQGFLKKTNRVDRRHIDIAERRRLDWISRVVIYET